MRHQPVAEPLPAAARRESDHALVSEQAAQEHRELVWQPVIEELVGGCRTVDPLVDAASEHVRDPGQG